jgi:hypothetical protein
MRELPLQAVLEYKPCPTPLTATYLQALSHAEGRVPHADLVTNLYTSTASTIPHVLPDTPLHPHTQYPRTLDLRAAINLLESGLDPISLMGRHNHEHESCLSWGTVSSCSTTLEPRQELNQLHQLQRHTDNISYADAYVTRSDDTAEEVTSLAARIGRHLLIYRRS